MLEPLENPLGDRLLRLQLRNGLIVLLNPRIDYARTFGVIATRFGSLDHELPGPDGTLQAFPDGVAHFLEHKLFEDQQGDVSLRFSSRGASCNAATEFTRTSYHFSCVDQVEDNLATLLGFVMDPWFTEQSVQKEQGIIEQEIRMYDDDADWRVFFQLMESMFHQHPVRRNIAGSVESIRRITPELLYRCHAAFYHPSNMVLSVCGGFDEPAILRFLERWAEQSPVQPRPVLSRKPFPEPEGVAVRRAELPFPISRPQAYLGFKDRGFPRAPREALRVELATRLALDVLFSQSSAYHQELYESGVIDDTFDASYSGEEDFGFSVLHCECDDPAGFAAAMHEVLGRARSRGLSVVDFERQRHRFLGRYVRTFNSVESTAGTLIGCQMKGIELRDFLRLMESIRIEELEQRLREHLVEDCSCLSILCPSGPAV